MLKPTRRGVRSKNQRSPEPSVLDTSGLQNRQFWRAPCREPPVLEANDPLNQPLMTATKNVISQ